MNAKSTFYIKSVNSQFSERRFYRGHRTVFKRTPRIALRI